MFLADVAILRMVGQQEFDHRPPGPADSLTVCLHLHPFGDRVDAGSNKRPAPVYFHQANPAGSWGVAKLLMNTEGWNLNTDLPRCFKKGGLFRNLHLLLINR
jgi:hypothetical protein